MIRNKYSGRRGKNIILSTVRYRGAALTFAQDNGGLTITSSTTQVGSSNFLTTSTTGDVYGLTVTGEYEKYQDSEGVFSSILSEVENTFSMTAVMTNPGTYVLCSSIMFVSEQDMLNEAAKILNKISDVNVWVIDKNGEAKFIRKP